MRPSFVNQPRPALVSVITELDPESCIAVIRNSENDGATGFDLHLRCLERQYHNSTDLERIIKSTSKPMMMIYYRNDDKWSATYTDEEREEMHMLALKCGASACDLMADMYDPQKNGISFDPKAIDRQKSFIDKVHKLHGEVVMSAHTWENTPAEQAVEFLTSLQDRGADMVKIATSVNSEEELLESFKTTAALKNALKVPFIHITMGQWGKLHRFVGPAFGSSVIFCVQQYTVNSHKEQPLIRSAKKVIDSMDWQIARSAILEDEDV